MWASDETTRRRVDTVSLFRRRLFARLAALPGAAFARRTPGTDSFGLVRSAA
jgi:hypothetical protein